MTSKNCTSCNIEKPLSEFYNGHYSCKKCRSDLKKEIRKTKEGLTYAMYRSMIDHSGPRGHHKPSFTRNEFYSWLVINGFDALYDNWVLSNYSKLVRPSVDRINDYKLYEFSNMQLLTWKYNFEKGHRDRFNGINNKVNKSVVQMNKIGDLIEVHHSMNSAARKTNGHASAISRCCSGKIKTSNGFRWMLSI